MPGQAKLEDSNVANIGGADHKAAVSAVAANAAEWKGAGSKVGIQVWRIEQFKVNAWPKREYGNFYSGDSYIVLHTYKVENALKYDLHFWLGRETTQDEYGTAAYKSVELDTLLDERGGCTIHREVQEHESTAFHKLFKVLVYMDGGVESGFHHVAPTEYTPRLMQFKGKGKKVRCSQVPLELKSLNDGDVFVMDLGLSMIQWNGHHSGAWERRNATETVREIRAGRHGRIEYTVLDGDEDHDEFWTRLGGKGPVAPPIEDVEEKVPPPRLYQVSNSTGELEVKEVDCKRSSLDQSDVFILDCGFQLVVWVGSGSNRSERNSAFSTAEAFLTQSGRPLYTPIVRVVPGGNTRKIFDKHLAN